MIKEAITLLRKQGDAKAEKRSGRVAAEGLVLTQVTADNKSAYIAEINCETDFVARDANFSSFANSVVEQGLAHKTTVADDLMALTNADGVLFEEQRKELVGQIGENINVRRAAFVETTGVVVAYNHSNRLSVLVTLDKDQPEIAKDIAMHIAAMNPCAIDSSGVDSAIIEREKEIFSAQVKESGKPDNIIEKMVSGRVEKFLKENCLLDQPFVKNPKQTVGSLLKDADAKIVEFIRYELGEGIEKETVDFADEVRAQVEGS